jgi:xylan 1,4-beta-xylosidase
MNTSWLNPIVRGTVPDPSIVRVGEDFYLANSTMDFWPGITIRHSTDLISWRIIGHAVTRPDQYRRDGKPGALMLYAPTLRYAEGRFFLACTNVADSQGNFVVSTDDPRGEWTDALWLDTDAFDPSLLYDEGTWFYTRRTLAPRPDGRLGPVVQAELDMATGILGELRELTPSYGGFCSNDIEGPHLYRIGEWYYLFSAEGGTWKGHMQTCARSRSPWGPFEPAPQNPVLTHRHRVGHPIQSLGHADLVDDADGNWWAVALGTRHTANGGFVAHHNLGRETFLLSVEWSDDGWPILGDHGTTELEVYGRALPERHRSDDSAVARQENETLWTSGWQSMSPPHADLDPTSLESIELPFGAGLAESGVGSSLGALFLGQTEDEQVFSARARVVGPGKSAGVACYSDATHYFSATVSGSSPREITFTRVVDDVVTNSSMTLDNDEEAVTFTIECSETEYRFFVGTPDRREVGRGSARLLSAETAEDFVGVRFALVALGPSGALSTARFDRISRREPDPLVAT